MSELSKETNELIKQLKALNENIDTLTKVTAVSIGQEEIFRDKETKDEKIEALSKIGLPNNIIAIMTGSTPHSVSQFKSMKRPKPPKPKAITQNVKTANEGIKQNEQGTA